MTNFVRAMLMAGMIVVGSGVATAGPLEDGIAASNRGEYASALTILRPLAEQGDAKAQYALGGLYWDGHGVAKDSKQALKWFQLSAGHGDSSAQYALGLMYSDGDGTAKDQKKAIMSFKLAAEKGNPDAQYVLGVIYDGGMGVAKDTKAAIGWFRRGAKQGYAQAQFSLAIMYALGKGVTEDAVRAQMWFALSAAHGADDPNRWADRWARKMSEAQVTEANEMGSQCEASNYKDCD